MEDFVVSARKYRPQRFNSVVGQKHITDTLRNAILNKQLAQAYLFCGPRGVGKTTCARIFAKAINCSQLSPEGEACDACESCVSFNNGSSLNIHELDAASNNSVDDIRNLVDQVRFAPQLGEYKVYIIDEVHMLSTGAFNAFLKTLEEPPKHAKFILATTERHKILPTILSRCQIFNFNRIRNEDIVSYLAYLSKEEGVNSEPEALQLLAQKADGGLRDACSLFDQMVSFTGKQLSYANVAENLNVLDHDYYFRSTDLLLGNRFPEMMLLLNEVLSKGFDGHSFLVGLAEHLRSLLVCKDPATLSLLEISDNLKQRFNAQAQQTSLNYLMKALNLLSKADVNYRQAKNQRLLLETTLMQLAFLNAPQGEEKKKPELNEEEAPQKPQATALSKTLGELNKPAPRLAEKPGLELEKLRIKSSFRLSELGSAAQKAPSETLVLAEPEPEALSGPGSSDPEQIKACILRFADEKQEKGSRQIATVLRTAGLQVEGQKVTLLLSNETQKEQLHLIRQEVVDYLRRNCSNPSLLLESVVSELPQETRAYKPGDVFKAMSQKNPSLLELKKRFDLEIDY